MTPSPSGAVVAEHVLADIKWIVGSGDLAWENGTLSSSATDLRFRLMTNSPNGTAAGTISINAVGGTVVSSSATGIFAGTAIPSHGAGASFSFVLPEISIDFDLGETPSGDGTTEFEFDNAGEAEEHVAGDGRNYGTVIVTDLATGPDGSPVSEVLTPDGTLGVPCDTRVAHVADVVRFGSVGSTGPVIATEMTVMTLSSAAPLRGYVRLWNGPPGMGGVPIGGDMTTNRLIEVEETGVYRVREGMPNDPSRPIRAAYLDLSWLPPLPPGEYVIEFALRSSGSPSDVQVIPVPWPTAFDGAMGVLHGQWRQLRDAQSGRPVSLAVEIVDQPVNVRPSCYANCDGSTASPVLNVADFTCFLQSFAQGQGLPAHQQIAHYANCDASTTPPVLNVADFTCFLQRFAAGCGH